MRIFTLWSRRFHRWIAYALGVLVALWAVTGVVMMFPPPPTTRMPPAAPVDPAAATVSPGDAFRALALGTGSAVRGLTIRSLGGRLVYHFALADGSHAFVDARTAQRVEFGDSLARALASSAMLEGKSPPAPTRMTQHDEQYRFGTLPVYRFELADAQRTLLHVAADGMVSSTSARGRFRAVMAALHEFQVPGQLVPNKLRKLLLLGASALTLVLVFSGYVLALPARWRR